MKHDKKETAKPLSAEELKLQNETTAKQEQEEFPGYPVYPESEDIYSNFKEEADLNPEDVTKQKAPNLKVGKPNEVDFSDDMSGSDLDVPGSELNENDDAIGTEDEENDFYSLGGDNHNDLEEDRFH